MKYIISIPAYNEEKTLGRVLKEIHFIMKKETYQYEIIVLNDGSNDNTVDIAKKYNATVFSNQIKSGLAITFRHEMRRCLERNADVIIHTDADGQYPAMYIPQLIRKIETGYELVLGSRFISESYRGSKIRYLGNIAFSKIFTKILKIHITDTTTGFRAFTKDVAKLPIINDFTYTQEQLIRAKKKNFKIGEIPIKTRKTRPSKLFKNPITYAIRAWINILRIFRDFIPLQVFGKTGFFFFFVGFCLGSYLLYLHFTTGIGGHIGLLILTIILLTSGLQIMLFGFLADMQKQ